MRRTAEFEAEQARERAAAEAKESSEQRDQGVGASESCDSDDQRQPFGSSTGPSGNDGDADDSDDGSASRPELIDPAAPALMPAQTSETPGSSPADSDGFVDIKYESSASPAHRAQGLAAPAAFAYRPADRAPVDGLPFLDFDSLQAHGGTAMGDAPAFSPYSEQDYYSTPSVTRFPSEMTAASAPSYTEHDYFHHPLRHYTSEESLAHSDAVSPTSMPESPSAVPGPRFKSPPPPADIAGRRKMRRPAPLGLSSLRGGGLSGPKTAGVVGADAQQRRTDAASPAMRRISSATGSLCGRVQKASLAPGASGPRSPFAMDRNKEALLHSLHQGNGGAMTSLAGSAAMSPTISSDGHQGLGGEGGGGDEQQGSCYPFGSLSAIFPGMYGGGGKADSGLGLKTTPPGTPGLQMGFHDAYFAAAAAAAAPSSSTSSAADHAWSFVTQDEPLPTPSLCSQVGSEFEFSMAAAPSQQQQQQHQQFPLPGYVAASSSNGCSSQPVTPSFPPPGMMAYGHGGGFFGSAGGAASLAGAHAEYHFPPDATSSSLSARSSPVAPPPSTTRSKQFQFAQNITPQDFTEKP